MLFVLLFPPPTDDDQEDKGWLKHCRHTHAEPEKEAIEVVVLVKAAVEVRR